MWMHVSIQKIKKMPVLQPVKGFLLTVKRIIQNRMSFYTENRIQCMLRKGFRIHHEKQLKDAEEHLLKIQKKPKKELIKIVFMCQIPSVWNSNMSTFAAADKSPQIEAYILALPDKVIKQNNNVVHEDYGENESYEYCRGFCRNTINAYDEEKKEWFDLKEFRPDYVFIQRPYDIHLPPQYRSRVLAEYTKICHIPYAYSLMNYASRLSYCLDFSDQVYAIFTENQKYCTELTAIYLNLFQAYWKKITFLGYPRFDLYQGIKKEKSAYKKTVLWLPRWTTNRFVEATTFFKYKDILADYFSRHLDIRFVCRPHPLMFRNFISTGEMTRQEVNEFKNMFKDTDNFYLDESPDYVKAIVNADVFISDTSSLLIEEFVTSKPILFCGIKRHFDKENMGWADYMYAVSNRQELLKGLEKLLNGEDPLREERKRYIEKHMKADGLAGERIVRFLIEDYGTGTV